MYCPEVNPANVVSVQKKIVLNSLKVCNTSYEAIKILKICIEVMHKQKSIQDILIFLGRNCFAGLALV